MTSLMRMASAAAERVARWSDAKRAFARRVMDIGAFSECDGCGNVTKTVNWRCEDCDTRKTEQET
jgi:hypothetical protein